MARLSETQVINQKNQLLRVLYSHYLGLTEAEIAAELGWQRRTVNNYLRELEQEYRAYRDGSVWHLSELER